MIKLEPEYFYISDDSGSGVVKAWDISAIRMKRLPNVELMELILFLYTSKIVFLVTENEAKQVVDKWVEMRNEIEEVEHE